MNFQLCSAFYSYFLLKPSEQLQFHSSEEFFFHMITKIYPTHRITSWLGWEETSIDGLVQPLSQNRVTYSMLLSAVSSQVFSIFKDGDPQSLWTTWSSFHHSHNKMLGILLCLNRISCPNTGNHWELDLSFLPSPPIKYSHMDKVPLNLPFSRLNNPSSLKPSHMTHAPFLNHLYGTLLDLLQYVHVSPVTRSPSLGTGPRHRWSPLPQGQLMAYGHPGVHQDPKGLSGVSPSL